ncbi:CopG family transcriptional regulator [Arachnia propionica]|uniref:CopG family transcriptional regulator n=1 Tax=Arachnia propionica TaxID=1750 RepID=A0A3P1T951_9ACTN|nr:CopG family transcriptional regulator [Arachnia propionica]RRD05987.1 CopG family transcriptional regulator [Arachnia propionica]
MRTTITLPADIHAEIKRLRREDGIGVSEAVAILIRRGMMLHQQVPSVPLPEPRPIGIRLDVVNVAEALEVLDSEGDPT